MFNVRDRVVEEKETRVGLATEQRHREGGGWPEREGSLLCETEKGEKLARPVYSAERPGC